MDSKCKNKVASAFVTEMNILKLANRIKLPRFYRVNRRFFAVPESFEELGCGNGMDSVKMMHKWTVMLEIWQQEARNVWVENVPLCVDDRGWYG